MKLPTALERDIHDALDRRLGERVWNCRPARGLPALPISSLNLPPIPRGLWAPHRVSERLNTGVEKLEQSRHTATVIESNMTSTLTKPITEPVTESPESSADHREPTTSGRFLRGVPLYTKTGRPPPSL